jgi:hypothetical protein
LILVGSVLLVILWLLLADYAIVWGVIGLPPWLW